MANPRRKYHQEYYRLHKEKIKKRNRNWFKNHPDYLKNHSKSERGKAAKRRYIKKLHDKVIDFLGGKCVRCGIVDKRILQINHKEGKGGKEFKKISPLKLYGMILRGERPIDDLEVRCANCNIIYEYESGRRIRNE